MRKKIAACLIAGNDVKHGQGHQDFFRCLTSLEDKIDAVYIAYNGEGDLDQDYLPVTDYPIFIKNFLWDDDFASARNQNLAMVPREAYDWILWIDTDDTLEGDLQDVIADLKPDTQGVFLRYDYAVDPDTEQVLAVQWRERLLRTDANWKWHYPIHEVCHAPAATQFARKPQAWIRHWRTVQSSPASTRERNRRILVKARAEYPEEFRFDYYFANEVYAEGAAAHAEGRPHLELMNAAIKAYDDYLPHAPSPDDAYMALHQIGECRRLCGDFEGAIKAEAEAMLVQPTWPDAYVGIAQSYMELSDWNNVATWARMALDNCGAEADTTQVREPLNNEYLPRLLIGIAHENKGELIEALDAYQEMLQIGPENKDVREKIERVTKALEEQAPEEDVTSRDRLKEDKAAYAAQAIEEGKQSICFFHRPLFEPWHPKYVERGGIGGSETAAIELSQRFARDGWRVVVYGSPGDYSGRDPDTGVEWYHTEEWRPTEEYDVFVSSRTPEVFDHNIKAKVTILWMHDVNVGDTVTAGPWGPRISDNQPTYVAGVSKWHCEHLRRLYGIPESKLISLYNGVNLNRFTGYAYNHLTCTDEPIIRQENKFVWSSSPDRGLDTVIGYWPEVRELFPNAELHVYYGWESINKILAADPNHPLAQFKARLEGAMEALGSVGIVWHDRVDQQTLAEALQTCDVWLYPTYFLETFCITAIEMQAAGVIPLVNNIAGLDETVALNESKLKGWPNNVDFKNRFLARLDALKWSKAQDQMREAGREHAAKFTWESAYDEWLIAISNTGNVGVNPKALINNG